MELRKWTRRPGQWWNNESGNNLRAAIPRCMTTPASLGNALADKVRYSVSKKSFSVTAVTFLVLLSFLIIFPHTRNGGLHLNTTSASGRCSSARSNPHRVKAPLDPDISRLTAFWPELKENLDQHGEGLPTLAHPEFQPIPPSEDEIADRTSLLTDEEVSLIRERHDAYVRSLPKYPSKTFKGRGIVMLAGGHYSEYAVIALGVLRESGSTLPVEVWRRDEREERVGWCDELEKEGIACRRLSDYLDTDILALGDGKEMKIFTMLFSSFEEVVFVDADNMALQKPELLFTAPAYKEHGAILWHDYWRYDNIDHLPYIIGLSGNASSTLWSQTTYESGQVVWDKRRHWKALLLAIYYNYHGPDLYYSLINFGYAGWGDKDAFPLALQALHESYYTVPQTPQNVWVNGHVNDRQAGMLQMSPPLPGGNEEIEPRAFFLHATTIKWSHRDFLCDGCLPIWHTDSLSEGFTSRYENLNAELHGQIVGHVRILDTDVMAYMDQDAELKMWRAMHEAACTSPAWRHAKTCWVAREYLVRTFGFRFGGKDGIGKVNITDVEALPDMGDEVCLVDPAV